jgi:hypothetical protein
MLQHHEIKLMNTISTKQRDILLAFADYEQGWITEQELEDKLTKIINRKTNK